ncbi:MAG: GHKL domain-containing protein [Lachnospiraceae bacterium]|nr:GHKL domain-containing protein [Lachnospiraceae bacterium]
MESNLASNLKVVVELFTYIYCLAELFGKKLRISIHAVAFIIVDLFFVMGINDFGFPEYFRSLGYIAMFLYGLLYYGESIKITLVNCFLSATIIIVLQLLALFPLYLYYLVSIQCGYDIVDVIYAINTLNELVINIGCFLVIFVFSRKVKLKKLSDFFMRRNRLIVSISVLILCGLGISFYQIVNKGMILNDVYIQMVYFVLIFLFVIYEWQKSRMDVEKKKAQLEMNRLYYDAYDQLIMLVRERQHDMKNHISAILSMIYTAEDFEELKIKQTEYCGYVIEQNEKTKLVLSSGNPLIAGFLYSKIREAENYNITIEYKIGIEKTETVIPEYELVEMAGILLDNAIEELNNMSEDEITRKIYLSIRETGDGIELIVANTSPCYEEDMTAHFFEPGYSSKGQNRGIGLSKLKRLVQDRKGNIMVYNRLRNDMNYLTFEIILLK